MVYRSRPFVYGDDPYHRWKVKPSVMISDLLARDLKAAGLFRSVYSAGDTQTGEYGLSGVIEEIYEREGDSRHHAVLSLNVTLLKANRQDSLNRTVFQKNYHSIQDMEKKDAESFARSVSRAMEMLSKEIIVDVYMAMRRGRSIEKADPADRGLSAR
jgi:ABC-type uncharacterized transport system auxiliary subunit